MSAYLAYFCFGFAVATAASALLDVFAKFLRKKKCGGDNNVEKENKVF